MSVATGTESLFEQLCSFENLLRAYRKAARGKRSRPDVTTFDYYLEGRLLRLRDQLAASATETLCSPLPSTYDSVPLTDMLQTTV